MEITKPNFYWMELEPININDAKISFDDNWMLGIVSEEDGGIIAYAIGLEHAQMIIEALSAKYPSADPEKTYWTLNCGCVIDKNQTLITCEEHTDDVGPLWMH
jgi:hypothetical protein